MLTGDKFETAENIGFSCSLLKEDFHLFKIDTFEAIVEICSEKTQK
jgi:magnesium-transporting ATPase (P-type)